MEIKNQDFLGSDVHEMMSLLKHSLKKAIPGARPWFFGCEYKCLLCTDMEPFLSTEALKRHIYEAHVNPWIYLVESGVLESKVEYFHCIPCDNNTVKKTYPDIKVHLMLKHEGMTMQQYADAYLFKDRIETKTELGNGEDDENEEEMAARILGIKKERIYDDFYDEDENDDDFPPPNSSASMTSDFPGNEPEVMMNDGEGLDEKKALISPKKIRKKPPASASATSKKKKPRKNASDVMMEADTNIKNDENYAKMLELLDKAQARYRELADSNQLVGVDKPYECSLCDWKFVNIHKLKRHFMSHFKIKPFKCDICGKGFSDFINREEHKLNLHSGEKKYSCEECGKAFAYAWGLKVHMKIHKGDKKYQCTECGKCFPLADYLKRHMPMHLSYKPYKCEICGKEFTYSTKYYKHKKTHTRGQYRCEYCGKTFNDDSNYYRHRKTHRTNGDLLQQPQLQPPEIQPQLQPVLHPQVLQQQALQPQALHQDKVL